jgi:hypothetical protein
MGGIYVVHHRDELRCHDTHTMFHKDWFRHSEVNRRGYAGIPTSWRLHKPTFIFQYKESRPKKKLKSGVYNSLAENNMKKLKKYKMYKN